MTIVYHTHKKTGVTYAYENYAYWDKEKQQSRAKRKPLGKIDPVTGAIVPTRAYKKKNVVTEAQLENSLLGSVSRKFYGATYLLDSIGKKLGIVDDLKFCFPNDYEQILSLVYYLIMEDKNPLFRFEKWGAIHKHPHGKDISSQRSSELLASITPDTQAEFFRRQGKRRIEKEYWAYDTTTISSYSETLLQVQHGKYKGCKHLPQIKLLLVFGEESRLPLYYRKIAGNTPDSKTVKNYLAELDVLGLNKTKVVMDRGFFSETNINGLYKEHIKFLIGAKISLKLVRQALDEVYDEIRSFENYSSKHDVYGYTVPSEWDYEQKRPYKGDVLKEKRRIYIHLYYNIGKAAEDERKMDVFLATLQDELLSDNLQESHKKPYEKYFGVNKTPKRGIRVTPKDEAIKEAKRYYGFFALVSNEKMDALTALEIYRARDVVEKAFGNLKDRLNFNRTFVSSEQTLDGKTFVEFVALIYLSYINKCMQEQSLYGKYTMEQVIDK